jgi:chitin synthase
MRYMAVIKDRAKKWRYFTYIFISLWKILVTLIVMMVVWHLNNQSVANLFNNFTEAFSPHKVPIQEASIFSKIDLTPNQKKKHPPFL